MMGAMSGWFLRLCCDYFLVLTIFSFRLWSFYCCHPSVVLVLSISIDLICSFYYIIHTQQAASDFSKFYCSALSRRTLGKLLEASPTEGRAQHTWLSPPNPWVGHSGPEWLAFSQNPSEPESIGVAMGQLILEGQICGQQEGMLKSEDNWTLIDMSMSMSFSLSFMAWAKQFFDGT